MSERKWSVVVEKNEPEYWVVLIWPEGGKEYVEPSASKEKAEEYAQEFTNYLESINWRP